MLTKFCWTTSTFSGLLHGTLFQFSFFFFFFFGMQKQFYRFFFLFVFPFFHSLTRFKRLFLSFFFFYICYFKTKCFLGIYLIQDHFFKPQKIKRIICLLLTPEIKQQSFWIFSRHLYIGTFFSDETCFSFFFFLHQDGESAIWRRNLWTVKIATNLGSVSTPDDYHHHHHCHHHYHRYF